ncbi:hypothetical protein C1Y63_04685 [Corynebacterium sp. 13CS0277]|uniref:Gp37-like protein n=1 Tax=Corynebacterium sp. 13CS0277 TaxID=2071994 RepID=UPI000D0477E2|nr:hypothetical protein [Corynebacterium sp. 13CS0277]PRQ11708.1 hypothetical protein C1Y63_04685 [Corynebacterium sp. 13CS0277]
MVSKAPTPTARTPHPHGPRSTRHLKPDLRVWDTYYARWRPIVDVQSAKFSRHGDMQVDTATITLPGDHNLSPVWAATGRNPAPVTLEVNGQYWTGRVTTAVKAGDAQGRTTWTLTLASDDKHLHRLLAADPGATTSTSGGKDVPLAVHRGLLHRVMYEIIYARALAQQLPTYLCLPSGYYATMPKVEATVSAGDSVAGVLGPILEQSTYYADVRMLLPEHDIPVTTIPPDPTSGPVLAITGTTKAWCAAKRAQGYWPHAKVGHLRPYDLTQAQQYPIEAFAGIAYRDALGNSIKDGRAGLCWVPMYPTGSGESPFRIIETIIYQRYRATYEAGVSEANKDNEDMRETHAEMFKGFAKGYSEKLWKSAVRVMGVDDFYRLPDNSLVNNLPAFVTRWARGQFSAEDYFHATLFPWNINVGHPLMAKGEYQSLYHVPKFKGKWDKKNYPEGLNPEVFPTHPEDLLRTHSIIDYLHKKLHNQEVFGINYADKWWLMTRAQYDDYRRKVAAQETAAPARAALPQVPGLMVHLYRERDRPEVVFATRGGGGVGQWSTTYNAPDGAEIVAAAQWDAWMNRLLTDDATPLSVRARTGVQAKAITPDQAAAGGKGVQLGDVAKATTDDGPVYTQFHANINPAATQAGSTVSYNTLGAAVNLDAVGAFAYRQRFANLGTGAWTADTTDALEKEWIASQGSVGVKLGAGNALGCVFGDDVTEGGVTYPGWRIGDRVRFADGDTVISEVVSGWEAEWGVNTPLSVAPILGRRQDTESPIDALVNAMRAAEALAGRAALAPPPPAKS